MKKNGTKLKVLLLAGVINHKYGEIEKDSAEDYTEEKAYNQSAGNGR